MSIQGCGATSVRVACEKMCLTPNILLTCKGRGVLNIKHYTVASVQPRRQHKTKLIVCVSLVNVNNLQLK